MPPLRHEQDFDNRKIVQKRAAWMLPENLRGGDLKDMNRWSDALKVQRMIDDLKSVGRGESKFKGFSRKPVIDRMQGGSPVAGRVDDSYESDDAPMSRGRQRSAARGDDDGESHIPRRRAGPKGAFDPSKYNQPDNSPRNRLSGLWGSQSNKSGGIGGGFGGDGGMGGIFGSSYKPRSILATARNLSSRIRLGMAGYLAISMASAMKNEHEQINQSLTKAGGHPGGMSAMGEDELAAKIFATGSPLTRRFGETAVNVASRSLANVVQIIPTGLSFVAQTMNSLGLLSDSKTALLMQRADNAMSVLSAASEGGLGGAVRAYHEIQRFGTLGEAKRRTDERADRTKFMERQNLAMEGMASEIAESIIGMDGNAAYEQLMLIHKEALKSQVEAQIAAQSGTRK
jgi:hypothetical protein